MEAPSKGKRKLQTHQFCDANFKNCCKLSLMKGSWKTCFCLCAMVNEKSKLPNKAGIMNQPKGQLRHLYGKIKFMGPASEYEDGVKGHKFASYQLILKDKNSDVSQKKKCHFQKISFYMHFSEQG